MSDTLKVWGVVGVYDDVDGHSYYGAETWFCESEGVFMSEAGAQAVADKLAAKNPAPYTTYGVTQDLVVHA